MRNASMRKTSDGECGAEGEARASPLPNLRPTPVARKGRFQTPMAGTSVPNRKGGLSRPFREPRAALDQPVNLGAASLCAQRWNDRRMVLGLVPEPAWNVMFATRRWTPIL